MLQPSHISIVLVIDYIQLFDIRIFGSGGIFILYDLTSFFDIHTVGMFKNENDR